jgi:hypothetical protein
MSPLKGRYFSQRDLNLVNSFNSELMGDIIENIVQVFKIAPNETTTNIYGETSPTTGKWYEPGIEISALIERPEMTTQQDNFGPDRLQTHLFKFREKMCILLNFYPEIGDIVLWNDKYFEISNTVQEQLLGGIAEKSHSIICNAEYTRLSQLNIVPRNIAP